MILSTHPNVFYSFNNKNVIMQINYSDDYLTVEDTVGKVFQINGLKVKVDRNIVYDGTADYYIAAAIFL